MEYTPLIKIKQEHMMQSVKVLLDKNNVKNDETSANYDSETFEPNYCLVHDIINDVIRLEKDSPMRSHAR